MPAFLSVNTIAFTFLGYPLSYVELVGTLFYLWSVWLIGRRQILTWPIGIISVLLFMALFYQLRFYGDAVEQVYYVLAGLYGWWRWNRFSIESGQSSSMNSVSTSAVSVHYSAVPQIVIGVLLTGALSLSFGALLTRVHILLPVWFPEKAAYPFWDALTTMMSFTAMWLMARQRIESWIYWIVVDVIGIGLYSAKDVRFLVLLYVALLAMAVNGFLSWHKENSVRDRVVAA